MLTLICGMPRAGKTTYAKRFDNVIHLDGLGYHNVKTKVSPCTDDITVEGVYEHPRQRTSLIEAYKGKGARCIWLDTPLEVRKTRPMWQPYHGLVFIPPTLEEGWDEIIIIRGDHEQCINRKEQT